MYKPPNKAMNIVPCALFCVLNLQYNRPRIVLNVKQAFPMIINALTAFHQLVSVIKEI
jgi:hypothetical protein